MNDDEALNLAQWRSVDALIDAIRDRDPDFPLRNAERCMTRQAWGLALAQIEQNLITRDLFGDEIVAKTYKIADEILPKDDEGNRLPFGFKF